MLHSHADILLILALKSISDFAEFHLRADCSDLSVLNEHTSSGREKLRVVSEDTDCYLVECQVFTASGARGKGYVVSPQNSEENG